MVPDTATRRKHLTVFVEPAHAALSPQMIAKIDTPAARAIYGQRLANGEMRRELEQIAPQVLP
jgi:hypothetical protein